MAKKRLNILLAIILVGLCFFNPVHAYAAEGEGFGYITLTNSRGTCAVLEEPSSRSEALFYLKHGTGVKIISGITNSDGVWYEIQYTKDLKGYVLTSRVSVKGDVNVSTGSSATQSTFGYIYTTSRTHPVRKDPSSSSTAIAYLNNGTGVSIIGQSTNSQGRWYKVRYTAKVVGYVHEGNIQTVTEKNFGYIYTSSRTYAVRKEPNSSSTAIAYLNNGTGVSIIGQITNSQGRWYKVRYTSQVVGYVREDNIQHNSNKNNSSSEANKTQKDGLVQVNTKLIVRSTPSTTSYDVLEYLYNGDCVTILETSSDHKWVKVKTQSGKVGWCSAPYVKEGKWVLVSTEKTTSSTSSANSRYNVSLACSRLTGIVISTNERFSWLDIMGACSKEKGFKESTVFENGKRVQGYGGGVCQVSTTINIAVKDAGIKTNAEKHGLTVSYADREDEASVAYPYLDFSFKNTLSVPIKLVLTASNGSCTCEVYKFVE